MIDDYQRSQRRLHVGSSDAAAICGRDAWGRTAGDVWAEKTGRVSLHVTNDAAITAGTFLEPAIVGWAAVQLNSMAMIRDVRVVHPGGILAANLDALALDAAPPCIVEAKSAGLIHRPRYLDDFGEPDTDEVPPHVLIQVHHQLACLDGHPEFSRIRHAVVPALLVGRGLVLFRLERNDALCAAIVEECEHFWREHVVTGVPPPDMPSLATLRRWERQPEPAVPIPSLAVYTWAECKRLAKLADAAEQDALRVLLAELGDAEVGLCDPPLESEHGREVIPVGTRFVYKPQTRKSYTVPESTFRVPRLVFPKKEKPR